MKILLRGKIIILFVITCLCGGCNFSEKNSDGQSVEYAGSNPLFKDVFTADPAPLVVGETLYIFVGHDNAGDGEMFRMPAWRLYSTKDLKKWVSHGDVLKSDDFTWAEKDSSWASQAIERNGKFYFYTTVKGGPKATPGDAIAVAVSDHPEGPYKDALGHALIDDKMTPNGIRIWGDIDPTVFIDDDGTAWLAWGNGDLYLVKLKSNMIELDGEISRLTDYAKDYTEGPWLFKRNDIYYIVYASVVDGKGGEQIAYMTSKSINGPWAYRGLITGEAANSYTIHPGIVEFKNRWLFFYHDASLTIDGVSGALGRRAVRAEYLNFLPDGSIQFIKQTEAGLSSK